MSVASALDSLMELVRYPVYYCILLDLHYFKSVCIVWYDIFIRFR